MQIDQRDEKLRSSTSRASVRVEGFRGGSGGGSPPRMPGGFGPPEMVGGTFIKRISLPILRNVPLHGPTWSGVLFLKKVPPIKMLPRCYRCCKALFDVFVNSFGVKKMHYFMFVLIRSGG